MEKRTIQIINRLGLHARAAARLVQLAGGFESEVKVRRDAKEVNGKSIMGVMMLAAGKGVYIDISAEGPDEQNAIEQIEQLIRNRFGEAE